MKSVIFFLLIHVSYMTTKTINQRLCGDNVQGDPREKRSDNAQYNDEHKEDENEDKVLSDVINEAVGVALVTASDDDQKNLPNTQQNYKPEHEYDSIKIINNLNTHFDNIRNSDLGTNGSNNQVDILRSPANRIKNNPILKITPSNSTSIKKIDISGLSSHSQQKKTIMMEVAPIIKTKRSNDLQADSKKDVNSSTTLNYTDITNIREMREHLLDHLLDYFINIIKEEEQYTETRKRNGKDKMKVEEKLRNYYSPQHIDYVLYPNESDLNEIDMDYPNGRRKADGSDLPVKTQNADDDTGHTIKIITLPQDSNIAENITYNIPKQDNNSSDIKHTEQQNSDNKTSNLQKANKRSPNLLKEIKPVTAQNKNINIDISINGLKETKLPNKKTKLPLGDIIIADNKTSTLKLETEKVNMPTTQLLIEKINKNENKIKSSNDNYLKKDESPKKNESKATYDINYNNDITAETTDLFTNSSSTKGSVKKLKPNADPNTNLLNIVKRKSDEQGAVNFTKAIVIQEKDCDQETKPKVEEKTLGQYPQKGNCKKNIILQFNINM